MTPFSFICPCCHAALEQTSPDILSCTADGFRFPRIDGIWRFLPPERAIYFEKFICDYETVRQAEGRGSQEANYYRALPYQDLSGKMPADWRIRAASFDALLKTVIAPAKQPLHILDLGAGNGWLSNRLAAQGHLVSAVDLMTNNFDGLGCHRFYETGFTPIQAEFDHLPIPDGTVDLVIFNASLHYSVDIRKTLSESLRVLTKYGKLVILDSPIYQDAGSGEKMVQEREQQFTRRFGFASNSLPSQNYLTYQSLQTLETMLAIQWQFITPYYGIQWLARPLKAKLSGSREPAKFHLLIGSKDLAHLKPESIGRDQITNFRYNGTVENPDDIELVAKVARGDEHAFLALYDRHASHVYALTLRILHDPMLAEEATQDTFLKLWGRARQYLAERGSLLVWLLTIARRTSLDRVRLEARRPMLSDSTDPEEAWPNIPDAGTFSDESRWRSMHFAVQALASDHRQVIELAYYQGLSQSEIAEVLGWPLGTVKTRLHAAMEQLRHAWGEK